MPLKRSYKRLVLAAALLAAAMPSAFAFEAVSNDQFPADTFSTKLADPDDVAADMAVQENAQHFFGHDAQISHYGNITVGIIQGGTIGPGAIGMIPERR